VPRVFLVSVKGLTRQLALLGALLSVGYAGPAVTIGAGLAGAAAANRGGASMGGSAASGLGTALIASFIPIAGTSTYTTSGSAGASHLASWAGEVAWYADGFVWLSMAAMFIALTWFRELRRLA